MEIRIAVGVCYELPFPAWITMCWCSGMHVVSRIGQSKGRKGAVWVMFAQEHMPSQANKGRGRI
jgi:hypothetical protein